MDRNERLAAAAGSLLEAPISRAKRLHGGDLSDVILLTLEDGREVVAKSGPAPRTEARMLAAMGRAGAPVPQVLGVADEVLVLSYIPNAGGLEQPGWAELGAALRQLHATSGEANGWPEPFSFGPLPINNAPCQSWPAFWAERRLLPEAGHLPPTLARRIDLLAKRLTDHLPAQATSLLHGDLWSGNLLARHGKLASLIDPACYHGHGEVDLAMLHLFGSPSPAFSETYGELPAGAEIRRAIYQLWPAIVHVRLFGAGYHSLVDRLLSVCGA